MSPLGHALCALAVLLLIASICGAITRRFSQPAILGELMAGVLLGPSVCGHLAPGLMNWLFHDSTQASDFLAGFGNLSATLLLFTAGLEIKPFSLIRFRKVAMAVSLSGIAFPFLISLGAAWTFPDLLMLRSPHVSFAISSLFFATALSISALPVIAKTLTDLKLIDSKIGTITLAAAVMNDLIGWMIFAWLLREAGTKSHSTLSTGQTLIITLGFAVLMLTILRMIINGLLFRIERLCGNSLPFVVAFALSAAAFTEWLGIHPLFGAFIFGVAISESTHFKDETRRSLRDFVLSFFAPVFIASIALKVDLVSHFNWAVVSITLLVACFGKIAGCGLAGRLTGLRPREAWSVGICMNSRGAMEIIVGVIALESGLIGQELFVALVTMAIITSMMVGPLVTRILKLRRN